MHLSIQTQAVNKLYEQGKELIVISPETHRSFRGRCTGESTSIHHDAYYSFEIINSFDSKMSGETIVPSGARCFPVPETFILPISKDEKFVRNSLVLFRTEVDESKRPFSDKYENHFYFGEFKDEMYIWNLATHELYEVKEFLLLDENNIDFHHYSKNTGMPPDEHFADVYFADDRIIRVRLK